MPVKSKPAVTPSATALVSSSKLKRDITSAASVLGASVADVVPNGSDARASLSALYSLASSLHSQSFPYFAKRIEVDAKKHITLDQIWGQLNVLAAPVISQVRSNLEMFEDVAATSAEHPTKQGSKRLREQDADVGDEEVDADVAEEDASEEEEEVLSSSKKTAGKKKSKDDPDAWRYAFGQGGEDEDEEMSEADDGGDANETASERRARLRNRQAMDDAAEDEENNNGNEEEEDVDPEDEKAALKELYGSDFSDDDAHLGDFNEEDEEDPEGFEGEEGEEQGTHEFNEEQGKYWGNDDILDDVTGDYGAVDGALEADAQEDDELNDPSLSEFQREQLRDKRRIQQLEQERLYNSGWAMGGEIGGTKRPKDSLIDEVLDFEHAMKPVPVNTEASTLKLEERIKRRIMEKLFDDVQRRQQRSTADDLVSAKRDTALEAQKSKLSLMDLYEKEYTDKMKAVEGPDVNSVEPLTEIEKDELRAIQMWKRLSQHLDALSNFFFTPKPVQQDLDARVRAVENQAPAIAIEAVGNFAINRENALAPQDLYRPSNHAKVGVSVDEMDPKEKRALRRAKKESFAHTKARKDKQTAVAEKVAEKRKAENAAKKAAMATKKKHNKR